MYPVGEPLKSVMTSDADTCAFYSMKEHGVIAISFCVILQIFGLRLPLKPNDKSQFHSFIMMKFEPNLEISAQNEELEIYQI